MHEWQITQELLDEVCAQAKKNGMNKITKIEVEVGKNGHITGESLRFCFQVLSENTIAKGAELEIKETEGNTLNLITITGEDAGEEKSF